MTAPTETTLLCRAAGCGWQQAPGVQLCRSHREDLGQWLAQLGDLYERLDATPSLQGRAPGTGSSGALAAHKSVGNLDVMVLRDPRSRVNADHPDDNAGRGVFETLAYWAGAVRQTQNLTLHRQQLPPVRVAGSHHGPVCAGWCAHDTCRAATLRGTTLARRNVHTERRVLADHLDWICRQDCAGQFCDDIRAVWLLLRAANHEAPAERRVPCPTCGAPVTWHDRTVGCGQCGTKASGLDVLRKPVAA